MTLLGALSVHIDRISIHTALAGCDQYPSDTVHERVKISIHTALAGCDDDTVALLNAINISIHTALAGCDPDVHRIILCT